MAVAMSAPSRRRHHAIRKEPSRPLADTRRKNQLHGFGVAGKVLKLFGT